MIFRTRNICGYAVALIMIVANLSSCSEVAEQRTDSNNYEKGKSELLQLEKKNPEKFLSVISSYKKNVIGQSVVKGKIVNTARMADYKDAVLKLSFFSKTGALLEEDVETIYERIDAGKSQSFKSKFFTPKGTSSVTIIVESAIVVR